MALIMLPFALQSRLGLSPPEVALMMMPWPLAVLLTTPVTARLLDHHLPQRLCSIGGTLVAFGLVLLALGSQIAGVPVHVIGVILCGIGFGLFQTPNNRTMFLAAPIDRAASVGGVQGTARLTGQVTGALIASILFSATTIGTGTSLAFGIAAVAAIASAVVSGINR
jgi:DHA2 family multidrug resistance protein-like MFS transporter